MRKATWACLSLIVLIGLVSSSAWAVERELAGVRLGDKAEALLKDADYGEPDFIGPIGTISVAPTQERGTVTATAPAARSGPTGPTGARGPRARSGGMRGGARAGMGARGPAMGAGRAGGGAMMGTPRTSRAAAPTPGSTPGMYWYYRRSGGIVLVLSLDVTGEVRAITLTGRAPYSPGRTTRGIGLTDGYMKIISEYGYPDQVVTSGSVLELTYVDHGVRFTLDSMRVVDIAIGAHIAAAAEVAPIAPEEGVPPPAGMSVEELRGYL